MQKIIRSKIKIKMKTAFKKANVLHCVLQTGESQDSA